MTNGIPRSVYAHSIRRLLAPVVAFLDDSEVTEIMINGPGDIRVERAGRVLETEAGFCDEEALMRALRHVGQYLGVRLDWRSPVLEGHLPDGSRIEAVVPPAAPNGPLVAIRRFSESPLTIGKLLRSGTLSGATARCLRLHVSGRKNVVVSGGTGTGKTSLLNAMASFVSSQERIVTIEDTRELRLQQNHVVSLVTQLGDPKGRGLITMADLFRATLRLRPDRIVLGEIRGGEALEVIQAMSSGHGGCMTTLHASSPIDALLRLETLALMSNTRLPLFALRQQIASAVQVVVQVARNPSGRRVVEKVCEVAGIDGKMGYLFRNSVPLVAASRGFRGAGEK